MSRKEIIPKKGKFCFKGNFQLMRKVEQLRTIEVGMTGTGKDEEDSVSNVK
jgi:hypothetical protein